MTSCYPTACYIPRICQNNPDPDELNKWVNQFTPKALLIGEIFSGARQGRLPFIPVFIGMSEQEVVAVLGHPNCPVPSSNTNPQFMYSNHRGLLMTITFQDQHVSKISVLILPITIDLKRPFDTQTLLQSIVSEDIIPYNPDINFSGFMSWPLNGYQLTMSFPKQQKLGIITIEKTNPR